MSAFTLKKSLGILSLVLLLPGAGHAAILGHVGERDVTADDVRGEYESMNQNQKDAVNKDTATRKNLIENYMNSLLLLQAAEKSGLDKDRDYLQSLDRFRKQYLASRLMQKVIEPKLDHASVKKFFNDNKVLFDSTQVCAEHILLSSEDEAAKVLAEAKATGADFAALAKKHSIDPTVQENKGVLGCFTRDQMAPDFAAAAFGMRKNEIKGPVRTIYGFHVIKVTAVKPGRVPNFEEVEDQVKQSLRVKLVQDMVNDLRAKSTVKLNEEEVKKFKL